MPIRSERSRKTKHSHHPTNSKKPSARQHSAKQKLLATLSAAMEQEKLVLHQFEELVRVSETHGEIYVAIREASRKIIGLMAIRAFSIQHAERPEGSIVQNMLDAAHKAEVALGVDKRPVVA